MAKALKIDHAFILKDGVMFKLEKGILKVHHTGVAKTSKPDETRKVKKSKN